MRCKVANSGECHRRLFASRLLVTQTPQLHRQCPPSPYFCGSTFAGLAFAKGPLCMRQFCDWDVRGRASLTLPSLSSFRIRIRKGKRLPASAQGSSPDLMQGAWLAGRIRTCSYIYLPSLPLLYNTYNTAADMEWRLGCAADSSEAFPNQRGHALAVIRRTRCRCSEILP